MAVSYLVLFATLLVGSLGSGVDTRADEDYPFRSDYSFSAQANGWLKLHRVPSTWTDARLRCHAEGAVLASPLNAGVKNAILKLVSAETVNTIFTGVSGIYAAGSYASVEGVPLSSLAITFTSGEPRSVTTNCLTMRTKGGTVGAVDCSVRLPFLCYRPRTADLTLTACGTHDTAYHLDTSTGSCYKFHARGRNWFQAHMTCDAEGGYLAIVNSNHEADILRRIFDSVPENDIFAAYRTDAHIGFRDLRDGGSWLTIHGETLDQAGYNVWADNNPSNATQYSPEGEACGSLTRNSGRFNDVWCGLSMPFICEKNPTSLQTHLG